MNENVRLLVARHFLKNHKEYFRRHTVYPQKDLLALVSVRGLANPRTMAQLKGLGKLGVGGSMTLSGPESTTFLLAALCYSKHRLI
jgi:hypothetical protein